MIVEKLLQPQDQASRTIYSSIFSSSVNTIWGAAVVASVAIFTIPESNLRTIVLSTIPIAALLVVYGILTPRTPGTTRFIPFLLFEEAIVPLSVRLTVILVAAVCVQTYEFGLPNDEIIFMVSSALFKALSWYFTTQIVFGMESVSLDLQAQPQAQPQHGSWCIATMITTFSIISSQDLSTQSSDLQAVLQLIAAFLVLGQIIHILPKQAKSRSALWAFLLLPLLPFVTNLFAIRNARLSAPSWSGTHEEHPVEALIRYAQGDFEFLRQTQSPNYNAACEEYRRRYHFEPPPGFEAWYEFAVANESPMIDEFDLIFELLSPFLKLSGKELIQRVAEVRNTPGIDLWHCVLSGANAETKCTNAEHVYDRNLGYLFNRLLPDLGGKLPNVSFLVNPFDEPRALFPPESWQGGSLDNRSALFEFKDLSRHPTWDAITKFCFSEQPNRGTEARHNVKTFGLPFVIDRSTSIDLCLNPGYRGIHGTFISPSSFHLIEGLVPILSTGSLSTMGHILFPSPAYMEEEFNYKESHDTDWASKENKLYWAGSTTGGWAVGSLWRNFHRQRFVTLAQNLGQKKHAYLREKGGVIDYEKSSFLNGRLYNVAFTKIVGCEKRYCREQDTYFRIKSWADKDRALQSRFVFDLDGNGISGRFYKLLESKSAPLKQTILREWHDDRLKPWVHYIPVSQSMEELPELIFYLTSTESGQKRAEEIAQQGREWYFKSFRDVDLTIYLYRLILELARLEDPQREATLK